MKRTNKYQIDCKSETCLWWWQPWMNSCLTYSLCAGQSLLGPCLTYQTCEQCPVSANEKKKCLEKFFSLIPLSQTVGIFFLPICFGLNWGPQSKNCKWLVWGGKEGSMSTAHPPALLQIAPHAHWSEDALATPYLWEELHIHAYLQTGVFSSLY